MTNYLFHCNKCDIYWDVEGSMAKPPKRKKCPDCGKQGYREYTPPGVVTLKRIRARSEEYSKKGMSKDEANTFLNNEIKFSKERMKSGFEHYAKVVPNADNMIKSGAIKRLDSEKAAKKKQTMIDMTKEALKRVPPSPHPQTI